MKKWIIPAICAVCIFVLLILNVGIGPQGPYVSCGDTYNKFLFIPAKSANFTIRFKSPFSGGLTLIDEKGRPLQNKDYFISVDGKPTGASFRGNGTRSVNVSIRCSTDLRAGRKYIRVQGGGPLITHIFFTHHMNPLLYWLSWLLSALSIVCLVWYIGVRRYVYPQFKTVSKMFNIPGQAPLVVRTRGVRMVVISDKSQKDSLWNALIKGPVLYKTHPAFHTPITLLPRRNGILVKTDFTKYKISVNPIPRIGACEIIDIINHIKITVQ